MSRSKFLKLFFYSGVAVLVVLMGYVLYTMFTPAPSLDQYGKNLPKAQRDSIVQHINDYIAKAEKNPKDADAWFQLGAYYRQLGATQLAIESYRKSAVVNPKLFIVFYNLGQIYLEQGNYDEAERAFYSAVKAYPSEVYLYRPLVELYSQHMTQKKNKIPELLNAGLALGSLKDNPELLSMLGQYYKEEGKREEAIQTYKRWLAAEPGNPTAERALTELQ